jgi:hypothetical protein
LKSIPATLKPALKILFAHHHRVDLAIQSLLEGQTGTQISIKVDDLNNPSLVQLEHGTFTVFAGEPNADQAAPFIKNLKKPCAIKPSPAAWTQHIGAYQPVTRYSFSHHTLQKGYLQSLIDSHPLKDQVKRIDVPMASDLAGDEWGQYHFLNFHSPEQFVQTGIGFGVISENHKIKKSAFTRSSTPSPGSYSPPSPFETPPLTTPPQ